MIHLYYFDESGFATVPSVPYAWQPIEVYRELTSFPSRRLNILGFMYRYQKTFFQAVEGPPVGTASVVAAFDRFAARYAVEYACHAIPCVVILDNAPWHTSRSFREQLDGWAIQGGILPYLPPYCPELNLIEILWRKIKYDWLPLSSYTRYDHLKKAVMETLSGFGYQYQINFV